MVQKCAGYASHKLGKFCESKCRGQLVERYRLNSSKKVMSLRSRLVCQNSVEESVK